MLFTENSKTSCCQHWYINFKQVDLGVKKFNCKYYCKIKTTSKFNFNSSIITKKKYKHNIIGKNYINVQVDWTPYS